MRMATQAVSTRAMSTNAQRPVHRAEQADTIRKSPGRRQKEFESKRSFMWNEIYRSH